MILYKIKLFNEKGEEYPKTCVWYSPGEIYFEKEQCIWMIGHIIHLERGVWEEEPIDSGYVGEQKSPSLRAPFETPECVRSELEARIKLAKDDGVTLVWEIQKGGIEYFELLCPAARKALNYVSINRRRLQTYAKWKCGTK